MTWVKLDDHFHDHPKIEALSSDAYRAFVGGLCYCARFLTDGSIPAVRVQKLASKKTVVELVTAGLWEQNGVGVAVHDYLEYQPSSEAIRAKRAADSARKQPGIATEPKRPVPVPVPKAEAKPASASKARKERPPDVLWDALVEVLKTAPETDSERGRWNKALKELRDAGATPDDIRARAREYRKRWPDITLTPTALSASWGSLAPKNQGSAPCEQCGVGGGQHTADCPVVAPFTDDDIKNVAAEIEAHR